MKIRGVDSKILRSQENNRPAEKTQFLGWSIGLLGSREFRANMVVQMGAKEREQESML